MSKKVIVIGAGPGGLSASMLLSHKGYQVEMFERKDSVGGRNYPLRLGEYTFDLGPTFFMMKDVLEDIFSFTGRKLEDYVKLYRLDPLYRLQFADGHTFLPTKDQEKMKKQMEEWIPGSYSGYQKYLKREKIKYDTIIPCLRVPYDKWTSFLSWQFIRSIPKLEAHKSLYKQLGTYFGEPDMRVCFSFQAKYLGMSPWSCPGTFSILSFIEHYGGIYHIQGGLNRLSHAMAKVVKEEGGNIHLNKTVDEIIIENGKAVGIRLENGDEIRGDYIIINADFAYAMSDLLPEKELEKYSPSKLKKKKYSCSTFMLYLGVDKIYHNLEHHNIIFSTDYEKNVREISSAGVLSADPSFYIQNASITDDSLAPAGKSTIYVLVPVPNNKSNLDWEHEQEPYKDLILGLMENRAGMENLRDHIEEIKVITPNDWEEEENVYMGATFNLAHTMDQMLIFRPHNRFEEFKKCYLVGGGTHPGSGLPTIYESGNITAKQIMEEDGMEIKWY